MKVDIVVVNWNSGSLLRDCLESVIQHGAAVVNKIVVVDNGSSDGSLEFLLDLPGITVIEAHVNLGFGRACNLGAKICESDFVLFLNPDARIYDHTLDHVVNYMVDKDNRQVGICGVQLENESGEIARSSSRFPTAARLFSQSIGLNKFFPRLGMPMNEWDHSCSRSVDQVIGAFFFVRRSLFDMLVGFDQRFFVYFEEVDFSYRAKILGWDSVFLAEAKAFHVGGGSSRQVKARRLFYSLRSRLQYAHKHFNAAEFALVVISTLLLEPLVRICASFFDGSSSSIKENFSAFHMLYSWIIGKKLMELP